MSSPKDAVNIGVSKALFDVKSSLIEGGADLETVVNHRMSGFVRDIRTGLEGSVCRIAFVGQIKAGKSSLINALIKKPDFLPTNINPSTAVVTKVFLGGAGQREDTALFHFFTDSEWDGLMSGNGLGRSHKSILSAPASRSKLDELQRRAEKRLGPNFAAVLGKHHLFSSVTPALLDQYVSTGDYRTAVEGQPPFYSDVTKMAEVFLQGPPFAHPSVMIDTPGINDLFFIRDEITHSNLADADIYIVVLSAQNPLSSADLSLLRLLRGLQRDKIIAVLNRIDSLENIGADLNRAAGFVRETLHREFPHASIPVLPVSALWANAALRPSEASNTDIYTARFDRFVRESGDPSREGASRNPAALLAYSGVPRLIEFISRFITNSFAEEQLLPGAATLSAVANNTAMSSRLSLRALAPDRIVNNPLGPISRELRKQAANSLEQLTLVTGEVEQVLGRLLEDWDRDSLSEIANLERYLFYGIEVFADAQAKAFIAKKAPHDFVERFSQDALRFRSELSDDFARHYTQIGKSLRDKQTEAESLLRKTVQDKLPTLDNVIQFGFIPRKIRPPSVMSLARATTLETEEFWAMLMRSPEKGESERIYELTLLISSEFLLILKDMLESARDDLRLIADEMATRLRLLSLSAMFPLVENLTFLSHGFLPRQGTGDIALKLDHEYMVQFQTQIKTTLRRQEDIASRLGTIKKQCLQVPIG